jgi:hypothetical protein
MSGAAKRSRMALYFGASVVKFFDSSPSIQFVPSWMMTMDGW